MVSTPYTQQKYEWDDYCLLTYDGLGSRNAGYHYKYGVNTPCVGNRYDGEIIQAWYANAFIMVYNTTGVGVYDMYYKNGNLTPTTINAYQNIQDYNGMIAYDGTYDKHEWLPSRSERRVTPTAIDVFENIPHYWFGISNTSDKLGKAEQHMLLSFFGNPTNHDRSIWFVC